MHVLALATALIAVARFKSGHLRSGWLCAVAACLILVDALAYSTFVSALAVLGIFAGLLAAMSETFPLGILHRRRER